jgi:hypothetical protein
LLISNDYQLTVGKKYPDTGTECHLDSGDPESRTGNDYWKPVEYLSGDLYGGPRRADLMGKVIPMDRPRAVVPKGWYKVLPSRDSGD